MLLVHWCLFSCAFLQLCSAQIIDCTVTPYSQYSDQTIYSISNVFHISDDQALVCDYSWSFETVLAHHKGSHPELVVRNSINELITSKCFDRINFTRNCIFESEVYMAYCTTNCTLNALSRSEKPKEKVAIAALVVVVVLVLVLLVVCAIVLYKFRGRISSSRPVRWIYKSVKTQNVVPNAAGLEAGESVESRLSSDPDM